MELNSIKLPNSFFAAEEIDGYFVTEKNKKIWAIQLDLLSKLLEVCNRNGIEISVFAGTMLGAVRHKGFIPWDDDIDICLTRENYKKLVAVAYDEFTGDYFFQNALSDRKFFIGYSRLRNSNTTGIIKWNNSPDYNNGIYIDIFPLDGYRDDIISLNFQFVLRAIIKKLCSAYCSIPCEENGLKRVGSIFLHSTIFKLISYESLVSCYDSVLQMYKNSKKVSLLTHSKNFVRKYWCMKDDLKNLINMRFELLMVPIPRNYNEILCHMYGNYMEFPPVEKRGTWHDDSLILDPDICYKEFMRQNV